MNYSEPICKWICDNTLRCYCHWSRPERQCARSFWCCVLAKRSSRPRHPIRWGCNLDREFAALSTVVTMLADALDSVKCSLELAVHIDWPLVVALDSPVKLRAMAYYWIWKLIFIKGSALSRVSYMNSYFALSICQLFDINWTRAIFAEQINWAIFLIVLNNWLIFRFFNRLTTPFIFLFAINWSALTAVWLFGSFGVGAFSLPR